MVACTCSPSYLGGWGRRIAWTQNAEVAVSRDRTIALQHGQQERNSISKKATKKDIEKDMKTHTASYHSIIQLQAHHPMLRMCCVLNQHLLALQLLGRVSYVPFQLWIMFLLILVTLVAFAPPKIRSWVLSKTKSTGKNPPWESETSLSNGIAGSNGISISRDLEESPHCLPQWLN